MTHTGLHCALDQSPRVHCVVAIIAERIAHRIRNHDRGGEMNDGINRLVTQKSPDKLLIAAVADDLPMLKVALEGGCKPGNITSPYYGTALIAAAHLGHDEVVRTLIASKAPLAIAACKRVINNGAHLSIDDALELEALEFGTLVDTEDIREGTGAFLEKRKPVWKGK